MERNEPCFCGSGLKYKKCHGDIREDSAFGKLITLYNQADSILVENTSNTKCTKGCDNCCYQYFNVSPVEFAYIFYNLYKQDKDKALELLDIGYSQWLYIKKHNPKLARKLESNDECRDNDAMNVIVKTAKESMGDIKNNSFPCVFLKNHECSIYEHRPFVCRYHGVAFIDNKYMFADIVFCDKTKAGINGTELSNLSDLDSMFLLVMESKKLNYRAFNKPYPIYYHCKIYKENLETSLMKLSEYRNMSLEMMATERITRAFNRMG